MSRCFLPCRALLLSFKVQFPEFACNVIPGTRLGLDHCPSWEASASVGGFSVTVQTLGGVKKADAEEAAVRFLLLITGLKPEVR